MKNFSKIDNFNFNIFFPDNQCSVFLNFKETDINFENAYYPNTKYNSKEKTIFKIFSNKGSGISIFIL